jgi:hypothetical protein
MKICNDCGWACEVVHKDYGDDLLVQTQHKGEIDHSRIWIQVKGTKNMRRFFSKKHGYSVKVSLEHALRWARSADLAVIVLWDIEKNMGLWALPINCLNQRDLSIFQSKTSRLTFNEESVFDTGQALKLAWMARIHHSSRLVNEAVTSDIEIAHFRGKIPRAKRGYTNLGALIALDFLKLIDVVRPRSIHPQFVKWYRNASHRLRKEYPGHSPEQIQDMAITLVILGTVDNIARGCGLPSLLLRVSTYVAREFMRGWGYLRTQPTTRRRRQRKSKWRKPRS